MSSPGELSVIGRHYRSGKCVEVAVRGSVIAEVREIDDAGHVAELPWIGPGFVDLQVNGMAGDDFNGEAAEVAATARITESLWRHGVTSYCPTVITNSSERIERSLSLIAGALAQPGPLTDSVAGIHLEGPFISGEPGAKGAHPAEHVQAPDWELLQRWNAVSGGRVRLVTMAPEWEGSLDFIRACRAAGIIVSLGHTAASPEQLEAAATAGAAMSTHFGNGVATMLPRHPNGLWTQLADDRLACCVIADGHHLPDAVLKVVYRVKGAQMILVSDAVQLCGMAPGEYRMPVGGDVVLTAEGRLHLHSDERLLAGSASPLLHGVNHLVRRGIAGLAEAWEMASTRPAGQLAMSQERGLEPGAPADLTLLVGTAGAYRVQQTIKSGICVYEAEER